MTDDGTGSLRRAALRLIVYEEVTRCVVFELTVFVGAVDVIVVDSVTFLVLVGVTVIVDAGAVNFEVVTFVDVITASVFVDVVNLDSKRAFRRRKLSAILCY